MTQTQLNTQDNRILPIELDVSAMYDDLIRFQEQHNVGLLILPRSLVDYLHANNLPGFVSDDKNKIRPSFDYISLDKYEAENGRLDEINEDQLKCLRHVLSTCPAQYDLKVLENNDPNQFINLKRSAAIQKAGVVNIVESLVERYESKTNPIRRSSRNYISEGARINI